MARRPRGELSRIYLRLVGARIRSDLQYRASFVLFTLAQFFSSFLDFLAILVIFDRVPALAGWSVAEVAFLYGVSGLAFSLSDLFVSEVEYLPLRIRTGTFDQLLIRPLGTLFQLVTDEFALRRIGKVLQAAVVLTVALVQIDVDWTPGRVAMVVVMVAAGAVIFSSVWVIGSTLAFWTTEANEVVNSFTYGGNFLTQYPLGVFGAWLRRLLAYLIPLGFVAYFPALYVLDRPDSLGAPHFVRFLSPLVALAMVGAARVAWRGGIRHYRSTGS